MRRSRGERGLQPSQSKTTSNFAFAFSFATLDTTSNNSALDQAANGESVTTTTATSANKFRSPHHKSPLIQGTEKLVSIL